jgi:hypothetical protein
MSVKILAEIKIHRIDTCAISEAVFSPSLGDSSGLSGASTTNSCSMEADAKGTLDLGWSDLGSILVFVFITVRIFSAIIFSLRP